MHLAKWLAYFAMVLAVSLGTTSTRAQSIAEGCDVPKMSSVRRSFYVDPIKGSMNSDGSAAHPWSTLADVFDTKRKLVGAPSSSVKPGDIIYLLSGDHGNVQLTSAANVEFITVQAAQGQTPRLRSLSVNGSSKWMFVGLTIQGAGDGSTGSTPGQALIQFGRNQSSGATANIVFAGNFVSTADDSSGWTSEDWVKRPFNFGLLSSASCVSITGNHFFNLRNALQFDGDRHFVAHNKIDNFGADGIDIIASNVVIKNNVITNGRHTKTDPLHPDGIQGWTKPGATNRNVVIDGNTIIKIGDPKVSEMQGIGIFDGKWDGLTISNNVVVTNHWHGIAVGGPTNAKIINNTVLASDPGRLTWITIGKAKDGRSPANVIIRNNIVTRLDNTEEGASVDHNLVARMIVTNAGGKPVYNSKPGNYGNGNVIDPSIYSTFMSMEQSKGIYDLRLKANSPAIGSGNPDSAPETDILGRLRVRPIDIGAYASSR